MKRKHIFSVCIILLFVVWACPGTIYAAEDKPDYGLFIKAFPSSDQEKTSLVLENGQSIRLDKEMTMSFDMYVRKDNVFGMVFRIITDNNDNIDLIFTVGENDKRYPMLVINESVYLINNEIKTDEWVSVSIELSRKKDHISIDYNGTKLTQPFSFSKVKEAYISLGVCPKENFQILDIASVNIRNIRIFEGKNLKRFWKLEKHNNNYSNDSIRSIPAIASNPVWITDIYATWEKIYTEKIQDYSLFAYNQDDNLIYIVPLDSRSIQVVNLDNHSSHTIQVKRGLISAASSGPNQIFYDRKRKELVTYNLNDNITSRFSFQTLAWSNNSPAVSDHNYTSNSVSFSEADSTFVSFGGYGFYKYNNEIIRLDKEGKVIKKSNLPDISPRNSASTTVVNNTLYILGGRGNKSGRQELSPKNTYDFYSVNLLTEQVNKLWEDENQESIFIPSENMYFDPAENCFYVFTSKDGGMLMRISTTKKGFEQMSFPIYEDLSSHFLYTNLYFSPDRKKFYVLVNKISTNKSAEVSIYSLHYPPIAVSSVQEKEITEPAQAESFNPFRLVIPITAGLLILGGLIYYFSRKKKSKKKSRTVASIPEQIIDNKIDYTSIDETRKTDIIPVPIEKEEAPSYDFSKSSICFLGGFFVSDKSGQNITGQFTPMLKFLLVLLILYTVKDEKGISGRKLIQLLWFDKSEDSAKNNRNVYMSKLRSLLDSVGNAEIINQNGFWSIHLHEDIHCDYIEAMHLFSKIREVEHINVNEVNCLLELLLRGVLLPNTEMDWTDGFKSDFSNLTIDILTFLSREEHYNLSDEMKLKIADTIFLHDYVNEEALFLKCSILYKSGKKGIAKTVYDNFRKEYELLLGVEYKHSLQDVINRKNTES